jgi:ribosome-associated toxin RatA of RatAB toxin-antitoxin module
MSLFRIRRKRSMAFNCKPEFVFDVLSDYSGYSEWMPAVKEMKLLATEANFAIVELELRAFPGEKMKAECVHARNKTVLMRSLTGHYPSFRFEWTIANVRDERIDVELTTEWGVTLPVLRQLGKLTKPLLFLASLASYIAAFTEGASVSDAFGEKIMEILETEEGLVCWYRGKKYLMKAAS